MPYVGTDFSSADPYTLESDIYTFDFTQRLTSPEVLTSAGTWSISCAGGNDFSPSRHFVGSAALTSQLKTSQQITGLVPGCKYLLQVTVLTSAGRTLTAYSHVSCTSVS